jgi:hypothetical protein
MDATGRTLPRAIAAFTTIVVRIACNAIAAFTEFVFGVLQFDRKNAFFHGNNFNDFAIRAIGHDVFFRS